MHVAWSMARDESSIDIWVGSNLGILKGKIFNTCGVPCEEEAVRGGQDVNRFSV